MGQRLNSRVNVFSRESSVMFFTIILTILCALLTAFYIYLTYHFEHWNKRNIYGPKPKPLFGNFPSFIIRKQNFLYDFDAVYRSYKGICKFVGVFTTRNPQIFIIDPMLAKAILTTKFKYFQDNESSCWMDRKLEPISGNNPFVLPSTEWKEKRADLLPGLTQTRVKHMYPIIQNICQKLNKYLNMQLENGIENFDAKDFSLRFTAEVVADVCFGLEAGCFTAKSDASFLKMSNRMISQTFKAFNYYFLIGIFPILRHMKRVRFFPPETDNFFLQLAQMARKTRLANENNINERQDLLQHLLELQKRKNLSDTELLAHMLTFHFDAFETSATLISHCLLLLARKPQAQQKLRQDIMKQRSETAIEMYELSYSELLKLPYLDQCVAETLRIFPPLPFMSKMCTEACVLEDHKDKYGEIRLHLQPGDICLISLYSFQHDEDYYAEPEEFLPERFVDESSSDGSCIKKYKDLGVYLPFGDGPRICAGMKFALTQVKAAIVTIVTNYKLTLNKNTRIDNQQAAGGFITGLEGGIHLNLEKIHPK